MGELPDAARAPGLTPADGDRIALVGPFAPSLAGSELAKLRGELGPGLPAVDLASWPNALGLISELARDGGLRAITDVSEGGLATALAELAIAGDVGLEADLDDLVEANGCSGETALFGEGPGGFLIAGAPERGCRRSSRPPTLRTSPRSRSADVTGGEQIRISAAEAEIVGRARPGDRGAWGALADRMGEPVSA